MSGVLWTIQVSNHPDALKGPPYSEASGKSWQILYDGPLAGGSREARFVVNRIAGKWYRHAQALKDGALYFQA